jgi:PDZ domain-containing protein
MVRDSTSRQQRCRRGVYGTDPLLDNGGSRRTVNPVSLPSDPPEEPQSAAEEFSEAAPTPTGSIVQRRTGWQVLSGVVATFVLVSLIGLALADSGRVRLSPGPTYPISYTGDTPSDTTSEGGWWMTTISVSRLNWAEATLAELLGDRNVLGTTAPVGSGAGAEMLSAKQTAALVAESLLAGGTTDQQLVVVETVPNSAADRLGLRTGDRLVSIDGLNATSFEAVNEALADGGTEMYVLRSGVVERFSLQGLVGAGEKLGVRLVAIAETALIDGERIETDEVGGSSGGLMFTLALLDAFTDGDLSGGMRVAGTGSIRADGRVGAILGAGYKMQAAVDAGYDVFLVPSANRADLPDREGIEIVTVDDVADAILWLCSNGGRSTLCPVNRPEQ